MSKICWTIAHLLNRIPGQCWADLVSWALGSKRTPWSPNARCRQDATSCGACYCGKLRAPQTAEEATR